MIYCCSDLHGDYDRYLKLIDRIQLRDQDSLYILGDVIDRQEKSIEILKDMMCRVNIIPLLGNHEYAARKMLPMLMKEITKESLSTLDKDFVQGMLEWLNIGGQATIDGFKKLERNEQLEIIDYLSEFSIYEEITVNSQEYILVHAGLTNFSEIRILNDYHLYELIFHKPEYNLTYFKDKYLVTGHTPTRFIEENTKPDYIYKANNHIAIDCGCGFGGQLGAICLDTGEEFYV